MTRDRVLVLLLELLARVNRWVSLEEITAAFVEAHGAVASDVYDSLRELLGGGWIETRGDLQYRCTEKGLCMRPTGALGIMADAVEAYEARGIANRLVEAAREARGPEPEIDITLRLPENLGTPPEIAEMLIKKGPHRL